MLKEMMPKCIIMDFDRTLTYLYRDESLLYELYNKMKDVYKDYIEVQFMDKEDGYYTWHKFHKLALLKLPVEVADTVNKKAENTVTEFEMLIIKKIGLFDGIADSILKLSQLGIELGVVSSNSTKILIYALEEVGLLDKFTYVEGRLVPFNPDLLKPNPYPVLCAKKHFNTSPIWYVGDDVIDIKSAKAAEVTAVGVTSGKYDSNALYESGADLCFESFVAMTSVLVSME